LKKTIFLFDLDGVIIDSKKNMKISWDFVKNKYNLEIKFNNYFKLIGKDFKIILKELNISKNFEKIEKDYIKQSKKNFNKIKLFPYIKRLISFLKNKNITIGIVTSKDFLRTKLILKKFSLKFDVIQCASNKYPSKPNPKKIFNILKKFNKKNKEAVYIGDMNVDKVTATNARVTYIHANYGYSNKKILTKYKINNLSEIMKKYNNFF
jgi:HAD superfamily hydrolase (TIGR01549 family)